MERKAKRKRANSIPRIAIVALSVLGQIGWMLLTLLKLNEYYAWIALATGILSAVVVLKLYSRPGNAAQKTVWIILILILPVMGLALYLMVELFGDLGGTGKRLENVRR